MRHTHRKDANHDAIRAAAERLGWLWLDLAQTGIGVDALLVKAGRLVLAEIKDGMKPISAQKLTPHEQRVHAQLKAHGITVEILTCPEDLLLILERRTRPGSYDDQQAARDRYTDGTLERGVSAGTKGRNG